MRIAYEISSGLPLDQHGLKDSPMAARRMHDSRAGLIHPALYAGERLVEREGILKNTRICADANERAQNSPAEANR